MVDFLSSLNPLTFSKDILTSKQHEAIRQLQDQWMLKKDVLLNIVDAFHVEMEKGLKTSNSGLLMIPSFVSKRSTGLEVGTFLALDFGGSNYRACLVRLKGKGEITIRQESFGFTKAQMHEDGDALFGYLAKFVGKFVDKFEKEHNEDVEKPLKLGFTFSFPVEQKALDNGILVRWTKGFESPNVVGREVVDLLQRSFDNLNLPIQVNALVNDTVGTLLASGYTEPTTLMGLILGTGTNAAYYEKTENIKKLSKEHLNHEEMIINMEWGNFDSDKKILPLTEYDMELDSLTWNPNEQIFEKTISGYYLGELFRIIVHKYTERGFIFRPDLAKYFVEREELDAPMLSKIVEDLTDDLRDTRKILLDNTNLKNEDIHLSDLIMVKKIGEFVGYRAAQLTAVGVSAVVLKRKDLLETSEQIIVGVDGSVYEKFPFFDKWLYQNIIQILGNDNASKVDFKITKDGSGVGAALTSMIASKSLNSSSI